MLKKFNEKFGVSGKLKRAELEEMLVNLFGSISYHKFPAFQDNPETYNCGVKEEWGSYNFSSTYMQCSNMDDALIDVLFNVCESAESLDTLIWESLDEQDIDLQTYLTKTIRGIYERPID